MPLSSLQPPISDTPTAPPPDSALPPTAMAELWQGHKIEAIKQVRLEQNLGLQEAKDLVDAYLQTQPSLRRHIDQAQADARDGVLRWLLFLLVGGAGLMYFLT